MKGFVWAPVLVFGLVVATASAWAFDCAKAYLPVDFVICSDPAAIRANEAHEKAWYNTRARLSDAEKQQLLADQRRWLNDYPPKCGVPARGKRPPMISRNQQVCVARALEERQAFLEQYPNGAAETQSSPQTTARAPESQMAARQTASSTERSGPFSDIRQVDFLNFTYPTGGQEDCGKRKLVTLRNGKFNQVAGDKELSYDLKYDLNKRDIIYGDFTKSLTPWAVILLRCNTIANYWTTNIYVYTLRNGMPALITKIKDGTMPDDYSRYYPKEDPVWDITSLRAYNGRLIIDRLVDAPHACPANIARFVYIWNGNSFVLAGKPIKRKNPEC